MFHKLISTLIKIIFLSSPRLKPLTSKAASKHAINVAMLAVIMARVGESSQGIKLDSGLSFGWIISWSQGWNFRKKISFVILQNLCANLRAELNFNFNEQRSEGQGWWACWPNLGGEGYYSSCGIQHSLKDHEMLNYQKKIILNLFSKIFKLQS